MPVHKYCKSSVHAFKQNKKVPKTFMRERKTGVIYTLYHQFVIYGNFSPVARFIHH